MLRKIIAIACAAVLFCMTAQSLSCRIWSFEDGMVPAGIEMYNGEVSVSGGHWKSGSSSLCIAWQPGAVMSMHCPEGIVQASSSRNGGMNLWIYNANPSDDEIIFSFLDSDRNLVCSLPFRIDFHGWRCIWARFGADMGKRAGDMAETMEIVFPKTGNGGSVYLDLLEFTPAVSWQNMSDAQYEVNRTDFSLIPDFMKYRRAEYSDGEIIRSCDADIDIISDRLEKWYLGSGSVGGDGFVKARVEAESGFIASGVGKALSLSVRYDSCGVAVGEPLFPWATPAEVDGRPIVKFRDYNEFVLMPLALDWRKNGSRESLEKALYIYDWFNDQGWADGSGMGTLCFEKLRSSGYFHSFFLLKDQLPRDVLERELNTIRWFTMFGVCYDIPEYPGEVADNLRALAIPKLIYALSLPDNDERMAALTAFKKYMDNALAPAPGFYGTLKPDGSGYHHRGPYHSAYFNHALYAGCLAAYLLHGTPYALSEETMSTLKNGLLSFRFFSADGDVPAGTTGRFPKGQGVLHELLPAFAYLALCREEGIDMELAAAFMRIMDSSSVAGRFSGYAATANSNLAYTSTVGEMELVEQLAASDVTPEPVVTGSRFYPYAGLFVVKDGTSQFNAKGFSRYVWDFESSATENLKGRYISNGHLEYFDFRTGRKSFNPQDSDFDWNYIPGTTSEVLPDDVLVAKGGSSSGHRHFSDETFLAGAGASGARGMFSVRLHDITYDKDFRADKSVFFFDDYILCIGSGISSGDNGYPVVTTIFQSLDGKAETVSRNAYGSILDDGSFLYVVPSARVTGRHFTSGQLVLEQDGRRTVAFIDHGKSAEGQGYCYYILRKRDIRLARKLLRKMDGILECDSDAHAATDGNLVSAAVFGKVSGRKGSIVAGASGIAYTIDPAGRDGWTLTLCDPDMRRPSREHMGLLTDEDVISVEQPGTDVVVLNGKFSVESPETPADVRYEDGKTIVSITAVRGENYRLHIKKI